MLRGMARLVGAAAVGAASMPSSPALCHVKQPDQDHAQQNDSFSALPSKPLVILRHDHVQDCGLEEDWIDRPHNHLVFAPPPTEQEVDDATKELRAALHLTSPLPGAISYNEGMEMKLTVQGERASSSLSSHLGTLAAGNSAVYQAFQLLQTNPQVQGAVKSLACDSAVWKAVLNNEKMQELVQSLQDRDEILSDKEAQPAKDESEEMNFCKKLTSSFFDFMGKKLLQLMGKIVDIVSSVFGSVEKTLFAKEDIKAMDMTVASCMMLAVAVLLVVVIKRGL